MKVVIMQSEQQFEQLIMQYNQLKNGSGDIRRMIEKEEFDEAITMLNRREELFLSCKCIRNYLELTPVQEKELNNLLDELRLMELENIRMIERGMMEVQKELKRVQKNEKIQQAYDFDENQSGNIANFEE